MLARILLCLFASVGLFAADPVLGIQPASAGATIFSGGAVPANTQVAYSNGSALTGDSAFTRGTLVMSLDANTDNTLTTGYGKMGFVPSGISTFFYIAQASNFSSTNYAFGQNASGSTFANSAAGQNVKIQIGNSDKTLRFRTQAFVP